MLCVHVCVCLCVCVRVCACVRVRVCVCVCINSIDCARKAGTISVSHLCAYMHAHVYVPTYIM